MTIPTTPNILKSIIPQGNHQPSIIYPLVSVYVTMERSTIFHGKIHDFDWAIFNSFLYVYQAGYQLYHVISTKISPSSLMVNLAVNIHIQLQKITMFNSKLEQITRPGIPIYSHDFPIKPYKTSISSGYVLYKWPFLIVN